MMSANYKRVIILVVFLIISLIVCLICYLQYSSRRYADFAEEWLNYEYDLASDKIIDNGYMQIAIDNGVIKISNIDFSYDYKIEFDGVSGRLFRKAVNNDDHNVSFDYCDNIDCVLVTRTDSSGSIIDITFGIKKDIPFFVYDDYHILALMNELSGDLIDLLLTRDVK